MKIHLSNRAQKVLALANEEVTRQKRTLVNTGDVLVGLLREGHGVAAIVLNDIDVTLFDVGRMIGAIKIPYADTVCTEESPLWTHALENSIRYAEDSARHLRHNYVGTEHLLLGLLEGETNLAEGVFRGLRVTRETVRKKVLEFSRPMVVDQTPEEREEDECVRFTIECVLSTGALRQAVRTMFSKNVLLVLEASSDGSLTDQCVQDVFMATVRNSTLFAPFNDIQSHTPFEITGPPRAILEEEIWLEFERRHKAAGTTDTT
ncbi:MAG: Clp protease N-terminal domain-containing protein [Candidatus Paceibacterota bacterium]